MSTLARVIWSVGGKLGSSVIWSVGGKLGSSVIWSVGGTLGSSEISAEVVEATSIEAGNGSVGCR